MTILKQSTDHRSNKNKLKNVFCPLFLCLKLSFSLLRRSKLYLSVQSPGIRTRRPFNQIAAALLAQGNWTLQFQQSPLKALSSATYSVAFSGHDSGGRISSLKDTDTSFSFVVMKKMLNLRNASIKIKIYLYHSLIFLFDCI